MEIHHVIYLLKMWSRRLNLAFVIVTAGMFMFVGCASVPGEVIRGLGGKEAAKELQQSQITENFHAKILSPHPPYAVSYHVTIQGEQPKATVQPQLLAQGRYANWTWVVQAHPQVAMALQQWRQRGATAVQSGTRGKDESAPTFDWDALMRRLYAVDQYLLGSAPMPLDIHILLLPRENYHLETVQHSNQALPVTLIVNDTNLQPTSKQFNLIQTGTLLVVTHWQQGLLADAEWKAGMLPQPAKGSSRKLKFSADQRCFVDAGGVAIADLLAGPQGLSPKIAGILIQQPLSGFRSMIVRTAYHLEPDSWAAKQNMVIELLSTGYRNYLKRQGLPGRYPLHGRDIKQINAIANYCRAFIRYTGDIDNHPLPLAAIQDGQLFPAPSTTDAGRGKPTH